MTKCLMSCALVIVFVGSDAYGWGQRGHHIVAETAARLVGELLSSDSVSHNGVLNQDFAKFMRDRTHTLGYLSNVPDTSWRDRRGKRRINWLNSPHHYFGPERILGIPEETPNFFTMLKAFPSDYSEYRDRYEGVRSPLPGMPESRRALDTYRTVGVTPWRSQELYQLLIDAFQCAKNKEEPEPGESYPLIELPFRLPADRVGESADPPLPTYLCTNGPHRKSELLGAVTIAGVLAHFIGDQGQPYHPTSDYDGWMTGNGGIHSYYESRLVQEMHPRLEALVYEKSSEPEFQTKIQREFTSLAGDGSASKLMIELAANSIQAKPELRQLDDQYAILEKSATFEWGDHPRNHTEKYPAARRKDPSDQNVQEAFMDITVRRLALSSVLLAKVWISAWEKGGRPSMEGIHAVSLPFPHEPPFIWPAFDPEALIESKGSRLMAISESLDTCKH